MNTSIHIRLEQLRTYYGITATDFASLMGMALTRYSMLQSKKTMFQLDALLALAENKPNLNFNWLIKGDGPIEQVKYKQEYTTSIAAEPEFNRTEEELKACKDRNALLEELLAAYRNK